MNLEPLRAALTAIDGVEESDSAFTNGKALWVNGQEICHFEDDGIVDIRLTASGIRSRRAALREDPAVTLRKSSSADWLEVQVTTPDDETLVVELVTAAARLHRPGDGTAPKPPPSGAELDRRRRFH